MVDEMSRLGEWELGSEGLREADVRKPEYVVFCHEESTNNIFVLLIIVLINGYQVNQSTLAFPSYLILSCLHTK